MRKLVLTAAFGACLCNAQNENARALAEANLGVQEAQQQHFSAAIEHYRRAAQLDPGLAGIHVNLGLAYFKSGQFQEALREFQKEDSRAASDRSKTLIAMSYFGLGEYKEAASGLEATAAMQPGNTEILLLISQVLSMVRPI